MATKSILKSVSIETSAGVQRLTKAMEIAQKNAEREVRTPVQASEANREDIKRMFGALK